MADASSSYRRILLFTGAIGLGMGLVTACADDQIDVYPAISSKLQQMETARQGASPSLYGAWTPSDGTSTKTFNEDGRCRGFFYVSSTGKPLDIGGPMSCRLSDTPDSSGRHKLLVTQGPNEATYLVEFNGDDAATVYTKSGKQLYRLSRF